MLKNQKFSRGIRLQNVQSRGLLLGILAFSLAGCGGDAAGKKEVLVPVSGIVKLDGRPTDGVRLSFQPEGDTKAVGGCWAITDAQGKFKVMHFSNQEGMPAGSYHVTFSRFVKPDGSPLPAGESPTMTSARESVAPMWNDPSRAQMHNKIIVPEKGSDSLDFNVSTAPKG